MEGLGKATEEVSLLVTSEVEIELIGHAIMSLHPLDLYLKFFLLCVSSFHSLSSVSELGCGQLCPAVLLVPPLMYISYCPGCYPLTFLPWALL